MHIRWNPIGEIVHSLKRMFKNTIKMCGELLAEAMNVLYMFAEVLARK